MAFVNYGPAPLTYRDQQGWEHPATNAGVRRWEDVFSAQGLNGLGYAPGETPTWLRVGWGVLATASMAASAYHGYKRNGKVGWALWWGFWGFVAPVITPTIALAQGFAKPKR